MNSLTISFVDRCLSGSRGLHCLLDSVVHAGTAPGPNNSNHNNNNHKKRKWDMESGDLSRNNILGIRFNNGMSSRGSLCDSRWNMALSGHPNDLTWYISVYREPRGYQPNAPLVVVATQTHPQGVVVLQTNAPYGALPETKCTQGLFYKDKWTLLGRDYNPRTLVGDGSSGVIKVGVAEMVAVWCSSDGGGDGVIGDDDYRGGGRGVGVMAVVAWCLLRLPAAMATEAAPEK
nr:hypothetical protein [Tanacetum cinerariifolium]